MCMFFSWFGSVLGLMTASLSAGVLNSLCSIATPVYSRAPGAPGRLGISHDPGARAVCGCCR